MAPAILTHYIDTQRNRLKYQIGVQILLPEHEEQQSRIYVADIKVIFIVSARQKNCGQTENRRQEIYQQHRFSPQFKKYYIKKIHLRLLL
jgi:hypothetical protein